MLGARSGFCTGNNRSDSLFCGDRFRATADEKDRAEADVLAVVRVAHVVAALLLADGSQSAAWQFVRALLCHILCSVLFGIGTECLRWICALHFRTAIQKHHELFICAVDCRSDACTHDAVGVALHDVGICVVLRRLCCYRARCMANHRLLQRQVAFDRRKNCFRRKYE